MLDKLVQGKAFRPSIDVDRDRVKAQQRVRAGALPFSLCAMQIIFAYEWLLSGVDKIASAQFSGQLPVMLRQSILVNRYLWYNAFLKDIVLPHASLLAPTVELGEIGIGFVLALSAVLWMWFPHTRLTVHLGWAACLALLGGILLSLNYFFQQNTPLPWIDGAQAFSPGMSIDMMIALLSVPLLAANLRAVRSISAHLPVARRR